MELNEFRIGQFIESFEMQCGIQDLTVNDVSGINAEKEFFEPSKQIGSDTSKYKVVPDNYFACNLMHVGRDCVLPIALNHSGRDKIVSPAYSVFKFNGSNCLDESFFFMLLKSKEMDRYFWFHTDSSIRDGMSWEDFCNTIITIPNINVQKKYAKVYQAILRNQQSYDRGIEDLKLTYEGYVDSIKKTVQSQEIGKYIFSSDKKNNGKFLVDAVRGVSTAKEIILTKAKMSGVNLDNYKIYSPRDIAYIPDTSRRGDKISLALNSTGNIYLLSSISEVFKTKTDFLLPEYLMLFFTSDEFDRYARFHSWGTARETFDWSEMCKVRIPIPDIKIQRAIADIYEVYTKRKIINESLKTQIKNICPILIRGAMEEAGA